MNLFGSTKEELARLQQLQRELGKDFIGTSFNATRTENGKTTECTCKITALYDFEEKFSKADGVTVTHVLTLNNTEYVFEILSWQLDNEFSRIKQNEMTNKLTCLTTRGRKQDKFGTLYLESKDISAKIEGFEELTRHTTGMTSYTWQLFDFLMEKAYEDGLKDNTVRFTLEQFMEMRGQKISKPNKDKTRLHLKEQLALLRGSYITYKSKALSYQANLIQIFKSSRGKYSVVFNQELAKTLEKRRWLDYPKELRLFKTNNPHSYYFLRKISLIKSINYGMQTADLISIRALLKSSPEIPIYEEIKDTGNIRSRIIEPTERDLDAIKSITWNYCTRQGEEVNRNDIQDYETFISLNVKIEWLNYPEREEKKEDE